MMKTITITLFAIFLSSCSSNPFHSEWYWETADAKSVQQKIKEGVNVNEIDNSAVGAYLPTPLHHAISYSNNAQAVKALIDAGANIDNNSYGVSRHTPLSLAVLQRKYEMIKTLIDAGADVNADVNYNNHGYTILDMTESKAPGNNWTRASDKIINLLKEHGAKYGRLEYGKSVQSGAPGEMAAAVLAGLIGAVAIHQANKQGFNQPIVANNNFPTNSSNTGNNIARTSGCSPLPARCQSANASAERNLVSCKSQDTGGIRGAALSQECALKAAIYAGKICESEFRKIGAQQCEYQMKQQINAWNNALISAVQTIRQVSGSGSGGGASTFTGGNIGGNTGSGNSYSGEKYCGDPRDKKPWRPGCGVK